MPKPKPFSYSVGDLLAIPLKGGGYGVAIVANAKYDGKVRDLLFLYGFDKVYESPPPLAEVKNLRITDAITVESCGDLSIREGRWIIIGPLPGFKEEEWPVPPKRNGPNIVIANTYEYGDICLGNDKLVSRKDFKCLPIMTGLGDAIVFESTLAKAIKERHPLYYFTITPHSLIVWDKCIKRAAAAGKVPWLDKSGKQRTSRSRHEPARRSTSAAKKFTKKPVKPKENVMSQNESANTPENHFWAIIESAKQNAKGDLEEMAAKIIKRLSNFTPQQIIDFKIQLYKTLHRAYTWDLWAASAIMCGGASDDGFEYWRDWLIAQGRETFEAALADPESLAKGRLSFVSDEMYEFETLFYTADQAYEEVTEESLEATLPEPPAEPSGEPWEEDELPERLPKLWKKYGER